MVLCLLIFVLKFVFYVSGQDDDECLVTEWSSWSSCTGICHRGRVVRSRRVTRPPLLSDISQEITPCPHLYESKRCNKRCSAELALEHHRLPVTEVEVCRPGEWGPWGGCQGNCENAWITRSRVVLHPAIPPDVGFFNPPRCPPLYEARGCRIKGCPEKNSLLFVQASSSGSELVPDIEALLEEFPDLPPDLRGLKYVPPHATGTGTPTGEPRTSVSFTIDDSEGSLEDSSPDDPFNPFSFSNEHQERTEATTEEPDTDPFVAAFHEDPFGPASGPTASSTGNFWPEQTESFSRIEATTEEPDTDPFVAAFHADPFGPASGPAASSTGNFWPEQTESVSVFETVFETTQPTATFRVPQTPRRTRRTTTDPPTEPPTTTSIPSTTTTQSTTTSTPTTQPTTTTRIPTTRTTTSMPTQPATTTRTPSTHTTSRTTTTTPTAPEIVPSRSEAPPTPELIRRTTAFTKQLATTRTTTNNDLDVLASQPEAKEQLAKDISEALFKKIENLRRRPKKKISAPLKGELRDELLEEFFQLASQSESFTDKDYTDLDGEPTPNLDNAHPFFSSCRVGPWQPWGPCLGACPLSWQLRHRPVVQPVLLRADRPSRGCPSLYEVQLCHRPDLLTDCTPPQNQTEFLESILSEDAVREIIDLENTKTAKDLVKKEKAEREKMLENIWEAIGDLKQEIEISLAESRAQSTPTPVDNESETMAFMKELMEEFAILKSNITKLAETNIRKKEGDKSTDETDVFLAVLEEMRALIKESQTIIEISKEMSKERSEISKEISRETQSNEVQNRTVSSQTAPTENSIQKNASKSNSEESTDGPLSTINTTVASTTTTVSTTTTTFPITTTASMSKNESTVSDASTNNTKTDNVTQSTRLPSSVPTTTTERIPKNESTISNASVTTKTDNMTQPTRLPSLIKPQINSSIEVVENELKMMAKPKNMTDVDDSSSSDEIVAKNETATQSAPKISPTNATTSAGNQTKDVTSGATPTTSTKVENSTDHAPSTPMQKSSSISSAEVREAAELRQEIRTKLDLDSALTDRQLSAFLLKLLNMLNLTENACEECAVAKKDNDQLIDQLLARLAQNKTSDLVITGNATSKTPLSHSTAFLEHFWVTVAPNVTNESSKESMKNESTLNPGNTGSTIAINATVAHNMINASTSQEPSLATTSPAVDGGVSTTASTDQAAPQNQTDPSSAASDAAVEPVTSASEENDMSIELSDISEIQFVEVTLIDPILNKTIVTKMRVIPRKVFSFFDEMRRMPVKTAEQKLKLREMFDTLRGQLKATTESLKPPVTGLDVTNATKLHGTAEATTLSDTRLSNEATLTPDLTTLINARTIEPTSALTSTTPFQSESENPTSTPDLSEAARQQRLEELKETPWASVRGLSGLQLSSFKVSRTVGENSDEQQGTATQQPSLGQETVVQRKRQGQTVDLGDDLFEGNKFQDLHKTVAASNFDNLRLDPVRQLSIAREKELAKIHESCQRQPLKDRCPDGSAPQHVIRWYYWAKQGECNTYMYSYCGAVAELLEKPLISKDECLRKCTRPLRNPFYH